MNCQLFSWFWPTLAKGPDSGSMKAIFTVSACAASEARPKASATGRAFMFFNSLMSCS